MATQHLKNRDGISKCPPERVNFNEPQARFLKRLLCGRYNKTVQAMNIFPEFNPQAAIDQWPYLKLLADDLLEIAMRLPLICVFQWTQYCDEVCEKPLGC